MPQWWEPDTSDLRHFTTGFPNTRWHTDHRVYMACRCRGQIAPCTDRAQWNVVNDNLTGIYWSSVMIKCEAECGLGIGIQEFSEWSPRWKYAGNWKGHAWLSREGFWWRETTETCFKQKGTVPLQNERLASSAISVEKDDRVKVLRHTWHKIGHFGDVFPGNLSAKYWRNETKHGLSAVQLVSTLHLHSMHSVRSVRSRAV